MSGAVVESAAVNPLEGGVPETAETEREVLKDEPHASEGVSENKSVEVIQKATETVKETLNAAATGMKTVGTAATSLLALFGLEQAMEWFSDKTTVPKEVIATGAVLGVGLVGFGIYKLAKHASK